MPQLSIKPASVLVWVAHKARVWRTAWNRSGSACCSSACALRLGDLCLAQQLFGHVVAGGEYAAAIDIPASHRFNESSRMVIPVLVPSGARWLLGPRSPPQSDEPKGLSCPEPKTSVNEGVSVIFHGAADTRPTACLQMAYGSRSAEAPALEPIRK